MAVSMATKILMDRYEVKNTDTLEGIAASHDCTVGELVKLNKLHSRMVFPGQKILVPNYPDDVFSKENEDAKNKNNNKPNNLRTLSATEPPNAIRGPGRAIPAHLASEKSQNQHLLSKTQSVPVKSNSLYSSKDESEDTECLQRFLKLRVKHITESDGTVTGTLLVTPNCLMYDPDISHPLVKENGSDLYGMVANMEDLLSVCMYKHIENLTGERPKNKSDMYNPDSQKNLRTESDTKSDAANLLIGEENVSKTTSFEEAERHGSVFTSIDEPTDTGVVFTGGIEESELEQQKSDLANEKVQEKGSNSISIGSTNLSSSDQMLPSIEEEDHKSASHPEISHPPNDLNIVTPKRRTVSDLTSEKKTPIEEVTGQDIGSSAKVAKTDAQRPRASSDLQPSTSLDSGENAQRNTSPSRFSRYSPNMARRSFGRLGRTLSAKATTIKDTVKDGAQTVASGTQKVAQGVASGTQKVAQGVATGTQKVAQGVATGTQKVAHGVVTHTKSAADHIQTGIQTSAKVVASVPGNVIGVGAELVNETKSGMLEVYDTLFNSEDMDRSPLSIKREQSLAKLEELRKRTEQVRSATATAAKESMFANAVTADEMPDLFKPVGEMVSENSTGELIGTPPDPPYYMVVRVDKSKKHKKKKSSNGSTSTYENEAYSFGNERKREFWFAIPRARADAIYHFLVQWSPEKYGEEVENADDKHGIKDKRFIVLDTEAEEYISKENRNAPLYGSQASLGREWEVVTVREMCRRLSLDDALDTGEMPLPEGSTQSQILDDFMIRQIVEILPPRAEGYPWVSIYNSEKHGFSLATLYRRMAEWPDDMSPIIIIIRDIQGHIFGAVASSAIRPCDHYYGTGDACLLFRFTGEYPHTRELRHYTWTGDNQFFINASKDSLSFGAGGGHYGLWLDADLNYGRSQKCATFDNEPLAGGQKEDFVIQFIEAFGFAMS
uniref:Oxidation resistance protein 1 n=1 Tax=Acrobeloides nanus TaxID=290746 RepID=A0A914C328_9BILA